MDATEGKSLYSRFDAAIRLSRWREHVPFTIPLTIFGSLLAVRAIEGSIDWRLAAVAIANVLSMSFAFIINNIEDAADDARDPEKGRRNVISSGVLQRRDGYAVAAATLLMAFLLFAASGVWTLVTGAVTLILGYFYSAPPLRLKARPITDVVAHALMLSGLLMMTGYFAYHHDPQAAWLVIAAAILFSAYGQFYNQVDDYDVDKASGLSNTVVLLGKNMTRFLSFACAFCALLCMAVAISQGIFPIWLGTFLIVGIITVIMFPWELDMRGNLATDGGNVQRPALIVANLLALVWLAAEIGLLSVG